MSKPIIDVRQLSKSYRLGTIGATSVKDEVARLWRRARGFEATTPGSRSSEFWALRDVSFAVQPGEVVGIIGTNGAGKSTLLKILSRITEQTSGEVTLRGRVASLLEVGTGFHPDLTGRENVFLNGAMLGMSKHEIHRKFEEIVAFAEVEQFIDTPVKRYSSGMYVRLAFAVAAHLEPEILLVDEVLAVGDAAFQQRCLGKMNSAANEGRTILFVSHNLAAVQNLCRRAVLLQGGAIFTDGPADSVLKQYVALNLQASQVALTDRLDRTGTGVVRFTAVTLDDGRGVTLNAFRCGDPATLVLRYQNLAGRELRNVRVGVGIDDAIGQRIALLSTEFGVEGPLNLSASAETLRVCIDRLPLAPGRYGFTLYFAVNGEAADWIQNAGCFDVEPGDYFGTGRIVPHAQGRLLIDHRFAVGATEPALVAGR